MSRPAPRRAGFTLVEAMLTLVMIGLMTSFMLPRLRRSEWSKSRSAAELMARDLVISISNS